MPSLVCSLPIWNWKGLSELRENYLSDLNLLGLDICEEGYDLSMSLNETYMFQT